MALSEHEQQLLDDLERSMHFDEHKDSDRVRWMRTVRTWTVLAEVFAGVVLIQVYLNSVSAGLALSLGFAMAYAALRLYRHTNAQSNLDARGRPQH